MEIIGGSALQLAMRFKLNTFAAVPVPHVTRTTGTGNKVVSGVNCSLFIGF
jgi:hypothetical protein